MLVRFLCLQDPGNNDFEIIQNNVLTELRFCKISFGITSSLFLLTRVVELLKKLYVTFIMKIYILEPKILAKDLVIFVSLRID